ncbi:glycosyltransferase, partial [Candidatus Altiarchaeota archaeon]
LPSIHEGMSNALLEAMAARKHIVASDIPENREIITDNVHGILVPLKDSKSITKATIHLLENKKEAHRMGSNARKRVDESYDIKGMIQKHTELYETLSTEGSSSTSFLKLPRFIIPPIHGEYSSHLEEFRSFGKKEWTSLFERNGLEVICSKKLALTSGHGFGFNRLRRLGEQLGFCSSYAYIMVKKGHRDSPSVSYFCKDNQV